MSVTTDHENGVLVVRMERESRRNAIDPEMTARLDMAFNMLEDDSALRAGVLTGTASLFSSGTDLTATHGGPTERGGEYGLVRRQRTKPLIAAVEGLALGGGFELVLACDLIVASTTAVFGLPEVQRGLIASCGALFRAPRALPWHIASELLLLGESIDAHRAYGYGLVNRLVEPGQAAREAIELAERIGANSPVSLRETMRAVRAASTADESKAWETSDEALAEIVTSSDFGEGLAAFAERRQPRWMGK